MTTRIDPFTGTKYQLTPLQINDPSNFHVNYYNTNRNLKGGVNSTLDTPGMVYEHSQLQDQHILFKLMMSVDDITLQNLCLTNILAAEVCRDDDFWKAKSYTKHGIYNKEDLQPYDNSWKRIYIEKPMIKMVIHPDGTLEFKKWYSNDQIKYQRFVKDGIAKGEQLEWYYNGQQK
jgi:hypothetical protein